MKTTTLAALIICSIQASAISIPKRLIGEYEASVPAFTFDDNGHTVQAAASTMSIILREDYLWYKTGMFQFYGEYQEVVEEGDFINVAVLLSNDLSVDFDMGLIINKKTGQIAVKGLTGVPEVSLEKRQITVHKK